MLYKSCRFHHQPFDFPRMTLLTQREQKIAFLRRSSSDYSRSTSQITSDNLGKHDDNADLYLYFSVPNDDNVKSARKLNQMFDLWWSLVLLRPYVQFLPQMGSMGGPRLCVAHYPPDIA